MSRHGVSKYEASGVQRRFADMYYQSARSTLYTLAPNWWLFLLRGVFAVLFGMLAMAWPGVTLLVLIIFYSAYLVADGAFAIMAALIGGSRVGPWWLALGGMLSMAVGVLAFAWPELTTFSLLYFIATCAIASGIVHIIGAFALRKELDNEWYLIAGGIISVFFGILVAFRPGIGALALVWVIGGYAVLHGILLTAFALRLRGFDHPNVMSA